MYDRRKWLVDLGAEMRIFIGLLPWPFIFWRPERLGRIR